MNRIARVAPDRAGIAGRAQHPERQQPFEFREFLDLAQMLPLKRRRFLFAELLDELEDAAFCAHGCHSAESTSRHSTRYFSIRMRSSCLNFLRFDDPTELSSRWIVRGFRPCIARKWIDIVA